MSRSANAYLVFTVFRYIPAAMTAVTVSVIQKACQTPAAPRMRHRRNADGMIMAAYLHREMSSDWNPFPIPSSAPADVTETAETTKPALMMRSAVFPLMTVSGLSVNRAIRFPDASRHARVPTAMIAPLIASVA